MNIYYDVTQPKAECIIVLNMALDVEHSVLTDTVLEKADVHTYIEDKRDVDGDRVFIGTVTVSDSGHIEDITLTTEISSEYSSS